MRRWILLAALIVGFGSGHLSSGQSVSVPYEKSNNSGWDAETIVDKKSDPWDLSGDGLTVAAFKDAGNSVNRNSQHWAFSPVIDLKAVSNFLVFSDKREGNTGSTFSVLVGPATAGTDRSQYVTVQKWTGTESNLLNHKIDLSPWNSEEQIRIAFLRENEAGASWNITGLKVLGSDVSEVDNFRVTAITDDAISLNWAMGSAQTDLQYLLVGSSDGDVSWSPERGSSYSIGLTVAPGVSVLYSGSNEGFVESELGEFVSRYYKLWVFSSAYEYSMEGSTASATTIGEATIFYEDFEDLVYSETDWAKNGLWADDINNWIVSGNADADSWFPKGGQTSYRGDKSAYIVETHSGTMPGYLGNKGGPYTPALYTSIPIPSEYKSAELSFYWKAGGQQGYDFGRVYVNNVPVPTELYGQTFWKQEVVDLSDYIGQTITLKFEWRNTDAYTGVNLPSLAVDEVLVTGKSVAKPELFSATVVNSSLVALDWEKNSDGNRVLVAYSSSGAFGSLNDGTAFEVGEQIPGGGEVVYKGDAERFEHAIASGNKAYYRIWSLADGDANTYSTALTASTVLPASLPFFDGFEEGFVWNVLPSVNNSWYRGRAKPKEGLFSAYVSGNGGFTTDYNGAWTDKPAILELPINLAGFRDVVVSFDWMLDGDINNTWGYVRMENGANIVALSNPSKLADKRTWQSVDSWIINNSSVFSSGSVLRFYMNINGGDTDLGFILDNVRINGQLNPVTSVQAANYGGLKNYLSWENAVVDASLEVVVLAFTTVPAVTNSLLSGEVYSVGDMVDGGRVVYVGGGDSFVHDPVLGGEEYRYQVYQKNGLTYSAGKTTAAVTTPENVVFYEDFETNPVWNITGGTGNTWEIGYPGNNGNGTRVAFVTANSPTPGYAGNKHSGSFVVSMVKTFTFPRLRNDVEFSFDYRVQTGSSGNGNNLVYDNALVTLSGDINHTTGKLGNNTAWQTYTSPLTLTGTGETATITMTVALEVKTESGFQPGFLIDNISITGAYDRNSVVSGSQGAVSQDLSSLLTDESDVLEPFRFSIADVGGDGQPTYVHQLEVVAGQDNTVSDWKAVLGGANLYKVAADNSLEYLATGIVQSQSILFEQEDLLVVPEGNSADFVIRPWLKQTLNSEMDNETLTFKILSDGVVASKGSSFKDVASSAVSDKYILRIDATELRLAQEPSLNTNKNTTLPRQPILIATDANGNIDSDFIGAVTVVSNPTGVNGNLSVNAIDGTASFEGLMFAESGSYTLAFSSNSLSGLTSAGIEVSEIEGLDLTGTSYIGAFRFAEIDSYTGRGDNGYELLTDQVAYLTTGVSYDMQVLFSAAQADGTLSLKAHIDYNDGKGFVDLISFGTYSNVSNKVEKRTVTIPTGNSGRYRLRLVLADAGKGEVEDYTVVISEGQWTGLAPQWDIRDNWTSGRIPLATDDVIIPSKPAIGVFFPVITDDRAVNNVTIESDARLTLKPGAKVTIHGDLVIEKPGGLILESKVGPNGLASLITEGSVSGEANVKLDIEGGRWYYLSSAVKTPTFAQLGAADSPFDFRIDIYRKARWISIYPQNGASRLRELEGVSVKNSVLETRSIDLLGELNSGEISRAFAEGGWHIFGNPYPSAITWGSPEGWVKENVLPTIWYRTQIGSEMTFVTYNAQNNIASHTPEEASEEYSAGDHFSIIPPYQAVWIRTATNAPATITVDNRVRLHNTEDSKAPQLKSGSAKDELSKIRIVASNQFSRDGSVIYFSEANAEEFGTEDSEKYFNDSKNVPEVYTRVDDRSLAINGVPAITESVKSIPISVRNRVEGDVTLGFDLSRFTGEHAVYFEDKTTGAFLNVARNSTYEYSVKQTGEDHDRFVLHLFKVTTDLEEVRADNDEIAAGEEISIKSIAGKVLVSVGMDLVQQNPGTIEIYTIDGRKISKVPARSSRTLVLLPNERGVYIVRAQYGQLVKSERVVNASK